MMLKAYKEWVHIKGSKTLREKPVMLQQFKSSWTERGAELSHPQTRIGSAQLVFREEGQERPQVLEILGNGGLEPDLLLVSYRPTGRRSR